MLNTEKWYQEIRNLVALVQEGNSGPTFSLNIYCKAVNRHTVRLYISRVKKEYRWSKGFTTLTFTSTAICSLTAAEEVRMALAQHIEKKKRENRRDSDKQMDWTGVLRCLKEGKVVIPNRGYDFTIKEYLEKIRTIIISLYNMGVLTEKEFCPENAPHDLCYLILQRIEKLITDDVIKNER